MTYEKYNTYSEKKLEYQSQIILGKVTKFLEIKMGYQKVIKQNILRERGRAFWPPDIFNFLCLYQRVCFTARD